MNLSMKCHNEVRKLYQLCHLWKNCPKSSQDHTHDFQTHKRGVLRATLRSPASKEVMVCGQGEMPRQRRNPLSDLSHIPGCKSKHKWQMIHDRLIFCGLTDKELLRQRKHSKKTCTSERSAPAGISERGWALETKQFPFPIFLFVTKGHIYGHSTSQTSEGPEKHTVTCEHTLL